MQAAHGDADGRQRLAHLIGVGVPVTRDPGVGDEQRVGPSIGQLRDGRVRVHEVAVVGGGIAQQQEIHVEAGRRVPLCGTAIRKLGKPTMVPKVAGA
ncbi:hypothetical protein D3C86_1762080 [compost metagenome]